MMKLFGLIAAFATLSASVSAETPVPPDPLLEHLVGHWTLSGTIAGKETTHEVTADWVLNRGYVRLHEVSRETTTTGAPAYEAIVFVCSEPSSGENTCLWLDSTASGGLSPEGIGRAKREPNSFPFVFKDAKGLVSFENTFSYDPAVDRWQWIMDNVEQGKRVPFGRLALVRQ